MSKKSYKHHKRDKGKFTLLYDWFLACEAWQSLPCGPRGLYIELKQRYNGSNNGEIYLSHRDAAKALNVSKDTAGAYFKALQEHEFITMTQAPCLGPSGIGQTSKWALQELPLKDGSPALKGFMKWKSKDVKKQKPVGKIRTPRPKNLDTSSKLGVI